jgi:hypothetical protein
VTANGAGDDREVVRLEEELLRTGSRRSPDRLRELLHPGYVEFGASGRRWGLEDVVTVLAGEDLPLDARIERTEVTALASDVVLLTYEAVVEGLRSLRSSVWVRTEEGWRLRFHQGTRVPDEPSR